jgi:hypothetical protein
MYQLEGFNLLSGGLLVEFHHKSQGLVNQFIVTLSLASISYEEVDRGGAELLGLFWCSVDRVASYLAADHPSDPLVVDGLD